VLCVFVAFRGIVVVVVLRNCVSGFYITIVSSVVCRVKIKLQSFLKLKKKKKKRGRLRFSVDGALR